MKQRFYVFRNWEPRGSQGPLYDYRIAITLEGTITNVMEFLKFLEDSDCHWTEAENL